MGVERELGEIPMRDFCALGASGCSRCVDDCRQIIGRQCLSTLGNHCARDRDPRITDGLHRLGIKGKQCDVAASEAAAR